MTARSPDGSASLPAGLRSGKPWQVPAQGEEEEDGRAGTQALPSPAWDPPPCP